MMLDSLSCCLAVGITKIVTYLALGRGASGWSMLRDDFSVDELPELRPRPRSLGRILQAVGLR